MPTTQETRRPLTDAERQARQRQRNAARQSKLINALHQILAARTIREARAIAEKALAP